MPMLARRWTALWLVASLVEACCLGGSSSSWTPVDAVPARIDDARALATDAHLEIEVEPIREMGGGSGGACHSAACLILLPVVLVSALIPQRVSDAVTLRAADTDVMIAVYDMDGALVRGRVRRVAADGSEHWLESERLVLPRLGVDRSIDVRRVGILPMGLDGQSVEIAQQPQLEDVVAQLSAALAQQDDASERVELLSEALLRIPEATGPVAVAHAARSPDAEAAAIVERACMHGAPDVGAEIAAARTDAESLVATVPCLLAPESSPATQRLAPRICDPATDLEPFVVRVGHRGWDTDFVALRDVCTGDRGTALRLVARPAASPSQIADALSADCRLAAHALLADHAEHLRAGIAALDRGDADCAEHVVVALSETMQGRALLEPGQAAALCDAVAALGDGRPVLTAEALWLLYENEVPADAAQRVSDAARAHPASVELASAALALGDTSFAPRVAPHVRDRERPSAHRRPREERGPALADYAMAMGCDEAAAYLRRPRGPCAPAVHSRPIPPALQTP
jgi:hypothetical protein